jgi:hypothetical protein
MIYYNSVFFKISGHGIIYSHDRISFEDTALYFEELLLGICIMPNGTLYVLTTSFVYEIIDFSIDNLGSLLIRKIGENDGGFNVLKGIIGTILNAASIPYNTLDDFDIDDKTVIKNLLLHYQSSRLRYLWYSTESKATENMFLKNIELLNEKLMHTSDPLKRADIEKKIAKQNAILERFQ